MYNYVLQYNCVLLYFRPWMIQNVNRTIVSFKENAFLQQKRNQWKIFLIFLAVSKNLYSSYRWWAPPSCFTVKGIPQLPIIIWQISPSPHLLLVSPTSMHPPPPPTTISTFYLHTHTHTNTISWNMKRWVFSLDEFSSSRWNCGKYTQNGLICV